MNNILNVHTSNLTDSNRTAILPALIVIMPSNYHSPASILDFLLHKRPSKNRMRMHQVFSHGTLNNSIKVHTIIKDY